MKNLCITLDKDKGQAKAREYFMSMCSPNIKSEKIRQKQRDDSLRTFENIYDHIKIKTLFSKYDNSCVGDEELICDNVTFKCKALSQLVKQDVLEVYIYLLTVGEIDIDCERVLYQVYYDMWQTVFVDAGRDLLKEYISKSITYKPFAISESFGPGFFGMPADDRRKFFQVLDADQLGMSIRPGGFMMPLKSCAGFFLISTKEESLPSKDCENCVSSGKTCSYCKAGRQQAPSAKLGLVKGDLLK